MLPTALRCLTSCLRSSRSSPVEVLCDPLQRLACQLRAPLQYTSSLQLPTASFATHAVLDRLQDDARHDRSCSSLFPTQLRQYCQQPVAMSDNVFTYEGPLKKAVGSLKARKCLYIATMPYTSLSLPSLPEGGPQNII